MAVALEPDRGSAMNWPAHVACIQSPKEHLPGWLLCGLGVVAVVFTAWLAVEMRRSR